MSKRDQFEVIKPRNLPKHKVGGSKLKLMGQPPQEMYRKLHPRMYGRFRFMCVAECWWRQIRNPVDCSGTNLWLICTYFCLAGEWDGFGQKIVQIQARRDPLHMCNRKPVPSFITRTYDAYFGIKLADQDEDWAPHMVCKACTETMSCIYPTPHQRTNMAQGRF